MGAALLVTAALVSLGGAIGDVEADAEVATGSRLRVLDERPTETQVGVERDRVIGELRFAPRLTLESDGRLHVVLRYLPVLEVPFEQDPPGAPQEGEPLTALERASVLHTGELQAEQAFGHWTLRAGAGTTYGEIDPLVQAAAPGRPFVAVNRIPYLAYVANAGVTSTSVRATTITLDARAGLSGGADAEAQEALPVQQEVRLDGSLEWQASPRTAYGGTVGVVSSRVMRTSDAYVVRAGATWMHELARPSVLRLAAGGAMTRERSFEGGPNGQETMSSAVPWGWAAYVFTPGDRFPTLQVTVGEEPAIDRLTGTLQSRAWAELQATWVPFQEWRVDVTANGAWLQPLLSEEDPASMRTWVGTVGGRIERPLGRVFLLGAGIATTWQDSLRTDLINFRETVLILDLTASMPRDERRRLTRPRGMTAGATLGDAPTVRREED